MKASVVVAALHYPLSEGGRRRRVRLEVLHLAGFEDRGREPEPRNPGGF